MGISNSIPIESYLNRHNCSARNITWHYIHSSYQTMPTPLNTTNTSNSLIKPTGPYLLPEPYASCPYASDILSTYGCIDGDCHPYPLVQSEWTRYTWPQETWDGLGNPYLDRENTIRYPDTDDTTTMNSCGTAGGDSKGEGRNTYVHPLIPTKGQSTKNPLDLDGNEIMDGSWMRDHPPSISVRGRTFAYSQTTKEETNGGAAATVLPPRNVQVHHEKATITQVDAGKMPIHLDLHYLRGYNKTRTTFTPQQAYTPTNITIPNHAPLSSTPTTGKDNISEIPATAPGLASPSALGYFCVGPAALFMVCMLIYTHCRKSKAKRKAAAEYQTILDVEEGFALNDYNEMGVA
jgi:hypothetical protein